VVMARPMPLLAPVTNATLAVVIMDLLDS